MTTDKSGVTPASSDVVKRLRGLIPYASGSHTTDDEPYGTVRDALDAAADLIERLEKERDEALHGRADSDGWADQFRAERDRAEAERDAAIAERGRVQATLNRADHYCDCGAVDAAYEWAEAISLQDRNPEVTRDE